MLRVLYKSLFLFALCLTWFSTGVAGGSDLEILSSTDSEFHFKISDLAADALLHQAQSTDSRAYARLVKVGVPNGASVRLVSATGENPKAGHPNSAASVQPPLASLSEPIMVRGRKLVTLIITPAQGSTVFDGVDIKLAFSGGLATGTGAIANDPQFDRVFKSIVANYETFKNWPVAPRPVLRQVAAEGPFTPSSTWYKLAVTQTGLHSVTGAQLQAAGLSLTNLPSNSIRLFNAGGKPLPFYNSDPRPDFREVAIAVDDGGDGIFNSNDRIYFYGESLDRWLYRTGVRPRYIHNVYTDRNIYWLTTGGNYTEPAARMQPVDVSVPGAVDTVMNTTWEHVHVERDSVLYKDSGGHTSDYYNWFWTTETELTTYVPVVYAVPGDSARVDLLARTGGTEYVELSVNNQAAENKNCSAYGCSYSTTALFSGLNKFSMTLTPGTGTPPYFDYLELTCHRQLTPASNRLDFVIQDYEGTAEIDITDNFTGATKLLDITDPLAPRELTGYERSSGSIKFGVTLASGDFRQFCFAGTSAAVAPASIEKVSPIDLWAINDQVDLFVVTPRQFSGYLSDYVAYESSTGRSIKLVTVEDIMENFGYGLYDPTAIRDFLKYAYENYTQPAPSAVLFVGDGTYDFRNILNTGVPSYVPTYIHAYAGIVDETYSDDNYVYFGRYGLLDSDTSKYRVPDRGVDMITARWPVSNAQEIATVVNKVKQYESSDNLGAWRDRITLVADDEFSDKYTNETVHTKDSEALDSLTIPRVFTRDKIYLWDYPSVSDGKPAVNDAIVKSINDGTLIINYAGHGNPDVWAHEHVFTRAEDLPRLHNADRLPLVFAASCAIGFYDDPERQGMGETFFTMSGGGAVGVISATRLVYASDNAAFNKAVYRKLLGGDDLSICEAAYAAKLERQYVVSSVDTIMYPRENDRAYIYFGDPFLKLGVPRLGIEFSQSPDSIQALGQSHVTGRIVDAVGNTVVADGMLQVSVYDSDRRRIHRVASSGEEVGYRMAGPRIYRGSATVTNGTFDFTFITPLDIGYGGVEAKLVAYAALGTIDAVGLVDSIVVSDVIAETTDSAGPAIAYGFAGRSNFISGDRITPTEQLALTLVDSSGINLAAGIGHGISLEIDGEAPNTVMLTDLFEYQQDDFTTGSLTYPLQSLEPGRHSFKIKAWDNANNSSSVEFTADVVAAGYLAIENLLTYPNPMQEATTFYFELTQPVTEFSLDIFTLAGRKIKSFNRFGLGADNYPNGSYELTWDGRDADGDRVATGVYIYKAAAQPENGGDRVESFGKIVVIN